MRQELGALTKSGKTLEVRSFYSGNTEVMFEHAAGMIRWSCQSVWLHNMRIEQLGTSLADSLAWQTHFPDTTADNTSLQNQDHVQYQSGNGGSTVEMLAS